MDTKKVYIQCRRCGRKLKSKESQKIGFGKVCWKKHVQKSNHKKLF